MADEITRESVLWRLKELHPDWSCSVGMNIWNHGNVHVSLSTHPSPKVCWSIHIMVSSDDRTIAEREAEALRKALGMAERGSWDKPPAEVLADITASTAGRG